MRCALETPGRTAALVTLDRALAPGARAELRRWEIAVDDSAGVPLGETPPGAYLRLHRAGSLPKTRRLFPCSPLSSTRLRPAAWRRPHGAAPSGPWSGRSCGVPRPAPGFGGLRAALKGGDPAIDRWLAWLEKGAAPFAVLMAQPGAALGALVQAHVGFSEWLAATDDEEGAARLWSGEAASRRRASSRDSRTLRRRCPPSRRPLTIRRCSMR